MHFSKRLLRLAGVLLVSVVPLCALVDRDGDGVSDVWAALYPEAGAAAADPDGDGMANRDEAAVGTNPLDGGDRFAVTPALDDAGRFVLRWPSVAGKRYRLEYSADLATWSAIDGLYDGTGGELSVKMTESGFALPERQFWRVVVSDRDADGDGLSDWEELQLGTVGIDLRTQDTDGDGMDDRQEFWQGTSPITPDPHPVAVSDALEVPRDVVVLEADEVGCLLAWAGGTSADGQTVRYFDILLNGRRVARTLEQQIRVGYDPYGEYLQFLSVRAVSDSGVSSAASAEVLAPRSHDAVWPWLLHKRAWGGATQHGFAGFTTNKCYRKCSEHFDQTGLEVGDRSGVILRYENRWVNSSVSGLSGSYSQTGLYGNVSFTRPNPEREREVSAYLARPHGGEGPYPGLYSTVLGTDTEKEYEQVGSGRSVAWGPSGYEWITWSYDTRWRIQLWDEVTEADMNALGQQRLNQARGALAAVDWEWLSFVGDGGAGLEPLGGEPGPPFAERDLDVGGSQASIGLMGIYYRLVSDGLGPATFRWREVFHASEGSIMQTVRDCEETVPGGSNGAASREYWIEPPATNGFIAVEPYSRHLEISTQSLQPEAGKPRLYLANAMYVGEPAELEIVFYDESGDFPETAKISWAGGTEAIALRAVDPSVVAERGLPAALAEGVDVPNGADLLGQEHTPGVACDSIPTSWRLFALGVKTGSISLRVESSMRFQGKVREIEQKLVVYPTFSLAVDANRDGEIKLASEDDSDATSAEKPFRFWLNDDDDEEFEQNTILYDEREQDDRDVSSGGVKDCGDLVIDCMRDLEDLARLWISTQGLNASFKSGDLQLGLKWTDVSVGDPAIRLFRAVDADGGTGYLFSSAMSSLQIDQLAASGGHGLAAGSLIEGTNPVILPTALFDQLSEDKPNTCLLFEGVRAGKGQLKLVILDKNGTVIGEGPGVWLELDEPGAFVERFSCGDVSLEEPGDLVRSPNSPKFEAPVAEGEKDYVLFVHGYNMKEYEKQRWIETVWKRLYWLGYIGRVGGFSWPCSDTPIPFDRSEERAWQSGSRLRELLDELKERGYRVHVLGHSQGAVVVSEALRLRGVGGSNMGIVDTCITSQAAIAAHCYNPGAPEMLNGNSETPNVYARFWSDGNSTRYPLKWPTSNESYLASSVVRSAALRWVNIFNPQDYALTTAGGGIVSWENDQRLKPNGGYGWGMAGESVFFKGTQSNFSVYLFPECRYQVFSFCAGARSVALGADPTGGPFNSFVNLQSFGFGDQHLWHSGQFRSSIAVRYQYWAELLRRIGLQPYTP